MKERKWKFILWSLALSIALYTCAPVTRETPPDAQVLNDLSLTAVWQYEANNRIRRIIGLVDNQLLVLYTYDRQFIALDVVVGNPVWVHQLSGEITNLVTREEILLKDGLLAFTNFIDNQGHRKLTVLDATTGRELWSRSDKEVGYAASTFAIGDKYIYWSLWPAYLAFDLYTGELVWRSELSTGSEGYSGLLYNNNELIIVRPDMYVLDADTGKIIRSLDFKINSTAYKIYGGIIYFVFGEIQALDTKTNTVLWKKRPGNLDGSSVKWTPIFRNNRLYLGLNGELAALDATTGELIWDKTDSKLQGDTILYSNPVFTDNTIYAVLSDGTLRRFNDKDGTEIGRGDYGTVSEDTALYATDEMLFVSLGGFHLYAYTLID